MSIQVKNDTSKSQGSIGAPRLYLNSTNGHGRPAAGLRGMKGRGRLKGSFCNCTHHCLILPCVSTSRIEIFGIMMQFIACRIGVRICMGLYLVQDDCHADRDQVTAVFVIDAMFVYVSQQSVRLPVCRSAELGATNLGYLAVSGDE